MQQPEHLASRNLGVGFQDLDAGTRQPARNSAQGKPVSRNRAKKDAIKSTPGQRIVDAVAAFDGSWTFDPYPHLLLNLFLSMVGAIQTPIILMSQSRHSERDRIRAEPDREVNLKAELETVLLQEKSTRRGETRGASARGGSRRCVPVFPWAGGSACRRAFEGIQTP